jgi:hypothetical protein
MGPYLGLTRQVRKKRKTLSLKSLLSGPDMTVPLVQANSLDATHWFENIGESELSETTRCMIVTPN